MISWILASILSLPMGYMCHWSCYQMVTVNCLFAIFLSLQSEST